MTPALEYYKCIKTRECLGLHKRSSLLKYNSTLYLQVLCVPTKITETIYNWLTL